MKTEQLLERFDLWEDRLRRCPLWADRVGLEPPFEYLFASERVRAGIVDDSRRRSALAGWFGKGVARPVEQIRTSDPISPPRRERGPITELQLLPPRDFVVEAGAARRLLSAFEGARHALAFEIIGTADSIVVQLCTARSDRTTVTSALRAHFPEIKVREREEHLVLLWEEDLHCALLNFGLRERVFRSLATDERLELDPLIGIIGSLNDLAEGESGIIQILFEPAREPWGTELDDFASRIEDVDRVLPQIRAKFAEPCYAAAIRIAALSPDEDRCLDLAATLAANLTTATRTEVNELEPIAVGEQRLSEAIEDFVLRETHRSGMILSQSELLTLVHPPSALVRTASLERQGTRTKEAPNLALGNSIVLGLNEHDGEIREVSLDPSMRLRHTYVIGASGTGKSTLLLSMAIQDIEQGNGFAVLDPHGDLVEDVLARIPEDRAHDVILFDPADEGFPIGFNILSAHSELERTLLASDLVSVFKRLSTTFGDVMVSVLGNAVLAFLESPQGGTLIDLRNFLVDASVRKSVLQNVRDDEVISYWEREFTLLKGMPHAPVLTRLNSFLRPKIIRRMVAQKDDRLDFRRIVDEKTIFLAKLSQGAIGEENSHLLGSLLVSKIAQAAMSRQNVESEKRSPYILYIDEFHHFVTPSIASILSGARKYGLGLVLAHQETRQLKSRSEEVASAVLGNAATRVVFRVGEQDAKALAEGFAFFEPKDLQSLAVGEAIARVERADFDFNLRTESAEPIEADLARARRRAILDASRASYATSSDEVDQILAETREALSPASVAEEARPRRKARPKPIEEPENAPLPGRGGAQHKYLQSLVARLARARGFEVTLEKTVLDGHGHIDVALVGHGVSVACEISVTTKIEHEVGNLTKGLAAGFDYAILISSEDRTLDLARAEMADADPSRVRIISPGALAAFLDQIVGTPKSARPKSSQKKASLPDSAERQLLSTESTAAYLGLAVQTLANLRLTGESPPFIKFGRRVMYDRVELEAWIDARRRRSTSDSGVHNSKVESD